MSESDGVYVETLDEFADRLLAEIELRTEGLTDEEYLATLDLLLEGIDNLALRKREELDGARRRRDCGEPMDGVVCDPCPGQTEEFDE